jgi:chemotaxis methyl-accepting protein methylase
MDAPAGAGRVETRAVRIRPAVVMSITPRDLNIVLQRLEPLAATQRFDLIIATNMLLYYDVFEQSLALTNIARMLRPGGWFLTNNSVAELPANPMSAAGQTDLVYSSRANSSDTVFWYQAR